MALRIPQALAAAPHENMTQWRARFLATILAYAFYFGTVVGIPSIAAAVWDQRWSVVAIDVVALAKLLLLWRMSHWSYRRRAYCLLGLGYLVGVGLLVTVGPVSQIYLMAIPLMAALLLGLRASVYALALNAVSLLAVGFVANADLHLPGFDQMPLLKWLVITLNFSFVSGLITLASGVMLQRLETSLRSADDTNAKLLAETAVRQRAEEEVRQLNAELEDRVRLRTAQLQEANRELEAFSYAVSHDLRSPLSTIDGFSSLVGKQILEGSDSARSLDYIGRIRGAVAHMSQLIDAMLQLAQVSRAELERQDVDLSAMAHRLVAAHRQREPQREVEVVIEPGMVAYGDGRLLQQVLHNLLGNAWKFTGREARPRISFSSEVKLGGTTVYTVLDNGAGFDMAYAKKLFGAFQRLHTPKEFPGTGVGLATVQRIVSRHCGTVWAESAPGQGAAFHFTLPYCPAEEQGPAAE